MTYPRMMVYNEIPWIQDHLGGSCAMMKFHPQNRSYRPVTVALACHPERGLRLMRGGVTEGGTCHRRGMPIVIVKTHHRAGESEPIPLAP
jgi:hypothetical protein